MLFLIAFTLVVSSFIYVATSLFSWSRQIYRSTMLKLSDTQLLLYKSEPDNAIKMFRLQIAFILIVSVISISIFMALVNWSASLLESQGIFEKCFGISLAISSVSSTVLVPPILAIQLKATVDTWRKYRVYLNQLSNEA